MQPDGKVVIGGSFTTINGMTSPSIGRLTSDGALDSSFTADGPTEASGLFAVNDFALQPDGRILMASDYAGFQGTTNMLFRFFAGLPALPGTIQWDADLASAPEGTNATLTATRTGGTAGALSVNFATVPATATTSDFSMTNGTFTWADGEAGVKSISIPITADALTEGAESFKVNLGSPLIGSAILGTIQQVRVNILSGFTEWAAANFTPAELSNPAISGDNADPDKDGIPNILEYAFGLAPKTANDSGIPFGEIQKVDGTNYLTLTFRRRVSTSDITYSPRVASSLTGTWSNTAVQVASPVSNGDGTETVTYRDTVAPSPSVPQRFMRVDVQRGP